jgi:HEXXH motif-containing protein
LSHLATADAGAARKSRDEVSVALLADIGRIVNAVNNNIGDAPGATWAAEKISQAPTSIVTRDLFQWYFKALDLLEQRSFYDVMRHCNLLPLVIAHPLAATLEAGEEIPIPVEPQHTDLRLPQLERPLPLPSDGSPMTVTPDFVCVPPVTFSWEELLHQSCFTHDGITFLLDSLGLRIAIADQGDPLNSGVSGGIHLEPIPYKELRSAGTRLDKMSAAMKMLHGVWPELYDEVNVSTDSYVLLRGPLLVGGTDFRYAGVTFLNMSSRWSEIAYMDHIAHEGTHNTLFFANELDPLVQNPRTESASPIRRTARPIIGTVHATMVFMRLVGLFEHMLQQSDLGRSAQEAEARLHRHALGLITGVQLIEDTAIVTKRGEEWLHGLKLKADLLARELKPDVAKAELVGDDYDPLDSSSASKETAGLGLSE